MTYFDDPIFKPFTVCGHGLPGTWQYLLPEDFHWLNLPQERLAVCDACPKVITDGYSPNCRCCTHLAQIPNFQLGLALMDPKSRALTQSVIDDGHALPDGIEITPAHLLKSVEAYDRDMFGKRDDLLCPFADIDGGGCGIYAFRNSICATFYCDNDHGDVGMRFWEKVQELVGQIETAIAQWSMEAAGMEVTGMIDRYNALTEQVTSLSKLGTKVWPKEAREHLWGEWFGKETQFFKACAEQVMANRDSLWEIACKQPLRVAYEYEYAVKKIIPSESLDDVQTLPREPGEPIPITDLWYKVQLATRQLWALPYNEKWVGLNPRVLIEKNPQNDSLSRLYAKKTTKLVRPREAGDKRTETLFLNKDETEALRLFETPQIIGEALLEGKELSALDNPKGFLAECMRMGILKEGKEVGEG